MEKYNFENDDKKCLKLFLKYLNAFFEPNKDKTYLVIDENQRNSI